MLIHGLLAFLEALGYRASSNLQSWSGHQWDRILVISANGNSEILHLEGDTLLLYGGRQRGKLSLADPDSLDKLTRYLDRMLGH